ncbi:hypothetical protein Pcinc_000121 [Petrolisthes cinctipes]|uniref:Uncharacterized protein n=1 Tax=Petrolisthes cinctipes TaxID=88211 RepID=A0AAE1L4C1_PETCI|nr:hypothetical protein Pcinc_000121 [Petrolisthes cinctipes]
MAAGDAGKSLDNDQSPVYEQTLKGVKLKCKGDDGKIGNEKLSEKALQTVDVPERKEPCSVLEMIDTEASGANGREEFKLEEVAFLFHQISKGVTNASAPWSSTEGRDNKWFDLGAAVY